MNGILFSLAGGQVKILAYIREKRVKTKFLRKSCGGLISSESEVHLAQIWLYPLRCFWGRWRTFIKKENLLPHAFFAKNRCLWNVNYTVTPRSRVWNIRYKKKPFNFLKLQPSASPKISVVHFKTFFHLIQIINSSSQDLYTYIDFAYCINRLD